MKTTRLGLSETSTTNFRAFMLGLMCLFCQANIFAVGGWETFVDESNGISYHVSYYWCLDYEHPEFNTYTGTASVTGLASNNEDAKSVIIPAYVNFTYPYNYDYPIDYIHDQVFSYSLIETFISENNDIGISYGVFSGCKYLSYVNLGEKVNYIAEYAFKNCTALKNISIPQTKYIFENAFEGCTALTNVEITGFVPYDKDQYSPYYQIGKKAFTGCTALRNIVLRCTEVPSCAWAAFDVDTYANATLYVPEGTLQAYRDDIVWSRFQHIVEGDQSAIVDIEAPAADGLCDVYSLSGSLLREGVRADDWRQGLAPGVYIVRSADGRTEKKIVR